MAPRATKGLEQQIYDLIPNDGRYERDIIQRFFNRYSQRQIERALQELIERGAIRKCGGGMRPLYVRKETKKVFYSNIAPTLPGTEEVLLKMDENFTKEEANENPAASR